MNIDLSINTDLVRELLTRFIRTEITRTGFSRGVIGLSGGVDSALAAFLAVEALGPENVLAVRMPYKSSSQDSLDHAQMVIDQLKMPSLTIPITEMADGLINRFPEMSAMRKGNIMARCRMITLYDQTEAFKGLAIGTGNKTEIMLGGGADLAILREDLVVLVVGPQRRVVEQAQALGLGLGPDDLDGIVGYKKTDASLIHNHTAVFEHGIRSQQCVAVDFKLHRQIAHRRYTFAGSQLAFQYLVAKIIGYLLENALCRFKIYAHTCFSLSLKYPIGSRNNGDTKPITQNQISILLRIFQAV